MFKEKMSAVRESVEWLFADIINYFKFLDFKKNLSISRKNVIVCNSTKRFGLSLLSSADESLFFVSDSFSIALSLTSSALARSY